MLGGNKLGCAATGLGQHGRESLYTTLEGKRDRVKTRYFLGRDAALTTMYRACPEYFPPATADDEATSQSDSTCHRNAPAHGTHASLVMCGVRDFRAHA